MKKDNLTMTNEEKISKAFELMRRAEKYIQKNGYRQDWAVDYLGKALDQIGEIFDECAPDKTWWREVFSVTGERMMLTDEGWEPIENLQSYLDEDPEFKPLDTVN